MHNQEIEQGEEADRIHLWYETHFQKKQNKWIDEKSEEIYVRYLNWLCELLFGIPLYCYLF